MIEIVKNLPFEDCEICQVFDPEIDQTKMFGDFKCLVNDITITCSRHKVCREIRRHLESNKEAENNGADK